MMKILQAKKSVVNLGFIKPSACVFPWQLTKKKPKKNSLLRF